MDVIGRYRITQRIGAGSFATVYKGHDDELDVPVAIKVLADNWSSNADVRARFLAEARLLRRIHDERIVRVHDIGTTEDGRPYFVMDHADGGSFEDLRRNLVEPGRALRLCAEAARGLEVLHREQMVHRDVTPGNILIGHGPRGLRVMLADLGVAKSMVEQAGGTMTAGTPAYMALEQANGSGVDQRCDVYSIAAVTYALLTGHPPFGVRTLNDLLARNPQIGPAAISGLLAAPPALDALLGQALSSDPALRPQSALEFATALDQIADLMPGGNTYLPRPLEAEFSMPSSPTTLPPTSVSVLPPPSVMGLPAGPGLVHPNETPASMLESYLGPGRYRVATPRERHSVWWYAYVAVALLALFGLAAWATIGLLR